MTNRSPFQFGGWLLLFCAFECATIGSTVSARAQQLAACQYSSFQIAIDVGRTPEAPGAVSARGVSEHSYNLLLGSDLVEKLKQGGFVKTELFTERGFSSREIARVERANLRALNLFLSIHHHYVREAHHGRRKYNGEDRYFSDAFSGYSILVSSQNKRYKESLVFAELLGTALTSRGIKFSTHHAEAVPGEGRILVAPSSGVYLLDDLEVLKFNKAPAAVLEAGIIVNRDDEASFNTPEGRALLSASVLEATTAFCNGGSGIELERLHPL